MNTQYCLQDLVRCHHCETPDPSLHCGICNIHLCKSCEGEHIYFSDQTKDHKVIPFHRRGCITKCQKHSTKICERYCEQCNIPVCELCTSCLEHKGHDFVDVMKKIESIKNVIQRDLKELDQCICPKYQEIALFNTRQMTDLNQNSKTLKTAIKKHGADLHKEIDTAITKLKSNLDVMNSKHSAVLKKQEKEIKYTLYEITQSIDELNKLLNSNDISLVFDYKSRNAEFRKLPPKFSVSLPSFIPQKINKEQLYQQFGSLSELSIETEKQVYTMDFPGIEASPLEKPFIDEPHIIADINTKRREFKGLRSVSCLSDEQIWASGYDDNILRLYNLQGDIVKSIQTRSENSPWDIAVTRSGDLVYADKDDRTVNIVKDAHIRTVIRLQRWIPRNICITSSADLLVLMIRGEEKEEKLKNENWYEDDENEDDEIEYDEEQEEEEEEEDVVRFSESERNKHTKVVRFSGSKEKQSIQYDGKGQPLYSSDGYSKYICENTNLDICVADSTACAVVVVNQAGKLRFTYNGPHFAPKGSFYPRGITTDSQSRILIADHFNECIQIVDQDGQFLRYIDNIDLHWLYGLCVDTKDNLFVVDNGSNRVKKIQYYNM